MLRAAQPGWRRCVGRDQRGLAAHKRARDRSLGHVGDGNLHVVSARSTLDDPAGAANRSRRSARAWSERALAMEGTCTGEHGVGLGKHAVARRRARLGDAVGLMRSIKRALRGPTTNILNPGKVFQL